MELINLHDFIDDIIDDFDSHFVEQDVELPQAFKEYVLTHKDGEKYTFLRYTSIVKASSELSTYCPNQWFYIAAYYCQLYPVLMEYKNIVLSLFPNIPSKELGENIKKCVNNKEYTQSFLESGGVSLDVADYLTSFLSDYTWWKGGKGIERGDFFYSPILSSAKLVNQNQAYVAAICQYLIENPKALAILQNALTDKDSADSLLSGKTVNSNFLNSHCSPFLTAIRTKPFLLLAGISGTGKSRIVRKLAQATNDIDFAADYDGEDRWKMHNPTNFCLIQVKPNWHNSMDVVGFKSNIGEAHYEFTPFIEFIAKAWRYPNTPFFLCLDEMNLAPVEEYFAEFLSAIESRSFNKDGEYETDPIVNPFDSFGADVSGKMIRQLVDEKLDAGCKLENQFRKKGLTLPKNLIVMGTVNMDETTFSFSRKVLDRAMSIEMNEVNYDAFLSGVTEEDVPLLTNCNKLLVERPINAQVVKNDIEADKIIGYLKQVNDLLEGTPFKLGYRAANEAFLYVSAAKMFGSDGLGSALDKFTVMKILSRIEGDDSKLKTKSGDDLLPAMLDLLATQFGEGSKSISVQKLTEMNDILRRDHFVSFWG